MVIDTSVIVAVVCKESGYEQLVHEIYSSSQTASISTASLLEARIVLTRKHRHGAEIWEKAVAILRDLEIVAVPFTQAHLA